MNDWISTPFSVPGRLLTPFSTPDSRTLRQNGALLPGWLLARCALLSSAFGSAGAMKPTGAPTRGADADAVAAASCASALQGSASAPHSAIAKPAINREAGIGSGVRMACVSGVQRT